MIDGTLVDLEEVNSELEGVEINPNFDAVLNSNGDLIIEQSDNITIEGEFPLNIEYDSRVVFRKQ